MILEEETKKKFGYYSWELSPKSNKRIIVACDKCGKIRIPTKHHYKSLCKSCSVKGRKDSEETRRRKKAATHGENHPFYGKHHTEETRAQISKNLKGRFTGKDNANYGKLLSEEHKKKLSKAHKGKKLSEEHKAKLSERRRGAKHPFYGKHHSEETKQKIRDAMHKNRKKRHHGKSKPEIIFENICKKHNLPFKYVGDCSLWIGPKKGKKLNPDFIEVNGKKQIVEIMGRYWHSPLLNLKIREDAKLLYREKHYKKYGWKTIFIWDTDLEREDAEEFVLSLFKK